MISQRQDSTAEIAVRDGRRGLRLLTVMNCPRGVPGGMRTGNASCNRELRALGWEVDDLYADDLPGRWGAKVDYALFGAAILATVRRWEQKRGPYDVLQVSGGDAYLASLLRRDRWGGRRLVVSRCHGLEHRFWAAHLAQVAAGHERVNLRHRLYYGCLRMAQVKASIRSSDLFNCHSRADAQYVINRGWKQPHEVCVLPSGVEPVGLSNSLGTWNGQRLVWSGTWTWPKGPRLLVEVFERLAKRHPNLSLTLVCPSATADDVLGHFAPWARARVAFRSGLSHAECLEEIQRHGIFLGTSVFEGFGTALVEAMAAGLVVVATPAGCAPHYIKDGWTGFFAPAASSEALCAAAERALAIPPSTATEIAGRARQAVRDITWPSVAAATAEVYRTALARVRSESVDQG